MIQPLFHPAAAAALPSAVLAFAEQEKLFSPRDRVLVAVSGGPDSVALLHLLARLAPELDLGLGVAHFNHGLRGQDAADDADFVARLAQDLGLPLHLGAGDVKAQARASKISVQMAARRLRLAFLEETCRGQAYDRLALGHTADDQVDLFFLRLLRGAGPEGVKGMWPARGLLVRPLLHVGKEVLLAWLKRESLPYREDVSNLDRRYLRNRLRLDLVPELVRLNPQVKTAVWRLMALLKEDERLLTAETLKVWPRVARQAAPEVLALKVPELLALPAGLQMRLLRRAAGLFLKDQEITFGQSAGLLDLARGGKSGGLVSLGTCQAARTGAELHFFRPLSPPPDSLATLPIEPGQRDLPPGWRWQLRLFPRPAGAALSGSPEEAWLDLDRLAAPLELRFPRPGDRFWPQGAPGVKKLQDFLVDAKIPRWLRAHLPLAAAAGRLLWVAGLRIAEPVKISADTPQVLALRIAPLNPDTARIWEMIQAFGRPSSEAPGDESHK